MTATLTDPSISVPMAGTPLPTRPRPVPLTTLTRVELRKACDTRAGRWLLAIVALIVVAAAVVAVLAGSTADRTAAAAVSFAALFSAMLLPVVGVLLVTGEWSQRTAQTTFTLVPRRGRVVAAKLAAGVLLGVAAAIACLAVGSLATLLAPHAAGVDVWDLTAGLAARVVLYQALFAVFGVGFGLLFQNSPIAIVVYFALPTAWTIASNTVSALHGVRDWLDTSTTFNNLLSGSVPAALWSHAAVSAVVWIGLPVAVGAVRVLRRSIG